MKPSRFAIVCIALALAACGSETKRATGGKAEGEILPASVNDAMLPHDTVRSQAPLAPSSEAGKAGKDKQAAKPAEKEKAGATPEPASAEPAEPAE
jgi:hypothetical protein